MIPSIEEKWTDKRLADARSGFGDSLKTWNPLETYNAENRMLLDCVIANWGKFLERQPESAVQPCSCGKFPAPIVPIAGCNQRKCIACYTSAWKMVLKMWDC